MSDTNKGDNTQENDQYERKMSDVNELETIHKGNEHEHCEAPLDHIHVLPDFNCDFAELISRVDHVQDSVEHERCEASLNRIQVESKIEVIEIFADHTSKRQMSDVNEGENIKDSEEHKPFDATLVDMQVEPKIEVIKMFADLNSKRQMSDANEGENIKDSEEHKPFEATLVDMEVEPKIEVIEMFADLNSKRQMSDANEGENIKDSEEHKPFDATLVVMQVEPKIEVIKMFADLNSKRQMSDANEGENIKDSEEHKTFEATLVDMEVEPKIEVIEMFADLNSKRQMSDANEGENIKDSEEHKPFDATLDDMEIEPMWNEPKIEVNEMAQTDSTVCNNFYMSLETVEECADQKTSKVSVSGGVSVDQKAVGADTKENELVNEKSKKKQVKRRKKSQSESVTNQINMDEWYTYKQILEQHLTKMKVSDHDKKTKSYDELSKMLLPPMTLYRERNRFYNAKREIDESLANYLERLKTLSETCQFGKRLDHVVTDKFITSLPSSVFYAFCTDGQTEIDSTTALEIARKNDDGCVHYTSVSDYVPLSRISRLKGLNKNIDSHLAEIIRNEIMEEGLSIEWDDIAGLDFAKAVIKESIVWPMRRPDIFTGLRKLPKGMLLFGPPGNGKTMIGKCIASQSKSTFFYVSAASLTSKWYGEGEKLVRILFAVAVEHQPSVIFFDEVDSLLTERNKNEHEASRRMKTEFMTQLDGAATKDSDRVLLIGATNRPQDLDEAIRRRFVKRLYIPLPDVAARKQLLNILLKNESSNLSDSDINEIATSTDGFSGADIKWLCQDSAMEPLRSVPADQMKDVDLKDIRPLELSDFVTSLKRVRPSVSSDDLTAMIEWDQLYGSNPDRPEEHHEKHFMYS